MPNLLDIRRRIRSVKNTQQITQAMKMVSAAKLRRAQEQALAARPYARQLRELMEGLAGFLDPTELADVRLEGENWPLSALLARREIRRRLFLTVTTDSGLVGAFNANVIKAAIGAGATPANTQLVAAGRKGRDFFRRHGYALAGEHVGIFARGVDYQLARTMARAAMRAYATGEVDEVIVVGNEFKSVLQQVIAVRRLLPFDLGVDGRGTSGPASARPGSGTPEPQAGAAPQKNETRDYIFEAPPAELLGHLLPRALETQIYRSLLESVASEHAARMNAMEAATSNAGELIDSLTLNMNRIRQAAITKEIIEVVSGASALG